MIGHIPDGFREKCTIFRWACTSGCGFEDEANLARLSALSFPGTPQENNVKSLCMKVGTYKINFIHKAVFFSVS